MAFKNKIILNPKTRNEIKFLQTSKDSDGKILEMESTYLQTQKNRHRIIILTRKKTLRFYPERFQ